ncbi:hypothetical protein [Propionibacterium australiense]|uniref:Scaffolding protein n=1 Tax=Propionibacterium australiense TaxID=119981 RepID=A0A8B3FLB8_9ACTN|nr:hypothetical protein [Propionibacterium australiense]RLP12258.1 hypothetical protein D7U36_03085 [Propionibacterium australiense]
MPDNTTTPAADPQSVEQPEQQASTQEPDWKAEYDKLKAQARKWEDRAKENYKARQRLDEIEEASKTEAQKQADALAASEARAKAAEARAAALEVSNETGIPVDLLAGPGDDLKAYAERLAAWQAEKAKAVEQAQPAVRPNTHIPAAQTPEYRGTLTIDEQIAAAEKAGDREKTMALKALKLGNAKQ